MQLPFKVRVNTSTGTLRIQSLQHIEGLFVSVQEKNDTSEKKRENCLNDAYRALTLGKQIDDCLYS